MLPSRQSAHLPQVSVIVPAYNVEVYIGDALESLKQQTFQDFEVLIVNDGSTDGTVEVVSQYIQTDSRFEVLNKKNGGLSSARNYGISHARGEYVAFLDADDAYHPHKLESHADTLNGDSSIGLVYSASKVMQDSGEVTWFKLSGKPLYKDPVSSLLCKNFIGHGSNVILRRSLLDQVGEFDETLKSSEDLDYWLRIALLTDCKFKRLSQPLAYYRARPSGLSYNLDAMHDTQQRVLHKALELAPSRVKPLLPKAYAFMYRYLARIAMTSGDFGQAREWIQQAWASDSSIFLQDPRSLMTLLAAWGAPLAEPIIAITLGRKKRQNV